MVLKTSEAIGLCVTSWSIVGLVLIFPGTADATEWFVAAGATGTGTGAAPFGRIQAAIDVANPGDTVTVRPGTYKESIRTVRSGEASARIVVRAERGRGSVLITVAGRVLSVNHGFMTIDGFVLDGQYAAADTVDVNDGGSFLTIRNCEVRRSSFDLVDIAGPQGVVIEGCLIHHALNAAGGRSDAHGIVAGAARDLTIRDTEIHTFSGDGFQIDPDRAAPGWDRVTLERLKIWLAPLAAAENGFAAGIVPGENAVDTKMAGTLRRATLTIRDTTAWGFRGGLMANMAAFNLKEKIDATVDRVTVYDSEIAFRLRGAGTATTGAWIAIKNAVVHNTTTAFRYEDNIQNLRVWNSTVGAGVSRPFRAASSSMSAVDVRNFLLLAGTLPAEAARDASNRAVSPEAFIDVTRLNYMLSDASAAIDGGSDFRGFGRSRRDATTAGAGLRRRRI